MANQLGLAAGVTGKCSVAMWQMGCPAGTCDEPAYGQQYDRNSFLMPPHWRFNLRDRPPLAMGYCCEKHGGPSETSTRFMRDGNMWMAFRPDFENLQESIAGFGPTQSAAYDDMAKQIADEIKARSHA